jgi:hypothetical protein
VWELIQFGAERVKFPCVKIYNLSIWIFLHYYSYVLVSKNNCTTPREHHLLLFLLHRHIITILNNRKVPIYVCDLMYRYVVYEHLIHLYPGPGVTITPQELRGNFF